MLDLLVAILKNTIVHRRKVGEAASVVAKTIGSLGLEFQPSGFVTLQCSKAILLSQCSHLSNEMVSTSEWVLNEIHIKHSTMPWHTADYNNKY